MGLFLGSDLNPTPRLRADIADDGLSALIDVDVFDGHLLLAFAAMLVERFQQRRICA